MLHFGSYDPTGFAGGSSGRAGVAKAFTTAAGPVTIHLARTAPGEICARAWGAGAEIALRAAPALCGVLDDPARFEPRTPDLARRFSAQKGLRFLQVPWVFDALVQVIFQQRVRFVDAARAYRNVVKRHGAKAPGPFELLVAPPAKLWLDLPPHELSALGVDKKRIAAIRHAARLARHVEKLAGTTDYAEARRVLSLFPGVGPWTAETFLDQALGDADAVATGDVHLPRVVCTALEAPSEKGRRYDDARMLELLAPWSGQRGRVVRLRMSDEGKTRQI